MSLPNRNQLFCLKNILTQSEIFQLERTRDIKSTLPSLVHWIAQTLNYFPWTYEYGVRTEAGYSTKDIENPLKTILITSWLCHAIEQGKLAYNDKPIRIKMDDYLVHHLWDLSLPTEHYSMCVESLYLFYQETNSLKAEFLSLDQLRVYPALKSDKPNLKGKQRCYLKVRNRICQVVEQAFLQHRLYLPTPPKVYNPLSKVDVDKWFSSLLVTNNINPVQASNEILNHVAQVQAICQKYPKRRNTEKNVQSVWVSF